MIKKTSEFKKRFKEIDDKELYKRLDKSKFDIKIFEFENLFKINQKRETNISIIINLNRDDRFSKMCLQNIEVKLQKNKEPDGIVSRTFIKNNISSEKQILNENVKCFAYDIYQENKYNISEIIKTINKIYINNIK